MREMIALLSSGKQLSVYRKVTKYFSAVILRVRHSPTTRRHNPADFSLEYISFLERRMQSRKFSKMKLGQNDGGNSDCASEAHSTALLPIAVLEAALFAALIIYDPVLGFIICGGKMCICWFVQDRTND